MTMDPILRTILSNGLSQCGNVDIKSHTSGKTSFGKLPPITGSFLPAFQRRPIQGNQGKYPPVSLVGTISSFVVLTNG
jgi:hypothetical protein